MLDKSVSTTAAKALSLLFHLADSGLDGLPLGAIAAASELSKPTAHRLLATLIAQGFAERVPSTRRYRLGPAGGALVRRNVALDCATSRWRQGLIDIVRTTGDPSFLLARSGDDALCLYAFYGPFHVRTLTSGVGGRMPLGSGPGSVAILATLPDRDVQDIIARNRPRLEPMGVRCESVYQGVREARVRGHCYDPGSLIPETAGLAIVLPQACSSEPIAISVGTLTQRLPGARIDSMLRVLRAAATSAIGGAGR